MPDGRAVGRRHQLDRGLRQARGSQPGGERGMDGARSSARPSEPPRRITALPDFRHSAPASAVTLGRLS